MLSPRTGRILSAAGAALLAIALFVTWYHIDRTADLGDPDTTGWQTFFRLRWIVLGGAAFLLLSAVVRQTRPVLIGRTVVGLVVAALIVRRIIDPPSLDYDVTPQLGVYLGALAALLAAAGGLIDSGRGSSQQRPDLAFWRSARRASCRPAPGDDGRARTPRSRPPRDVVDSDRQRDLSGRGGRAVRHRHAAAPAAPADRRRDRARRRLRALHPRPEVGAFEDELAAYCGVRHAVGVANGTEALTIALRAMGVGPGDDVVVPSFTFYASAEAIPPTGARPVFCDVDPATGCVTAETVRAALTPATKAVIAVHLFGNVAPVAEIEALGVPVLEDAAQAAGSRSDARSPGRARPRGDVQLLPLEEPRLLRRRRRDHDRRRRVAERARTLRFHGSHDKVTYDLVGYNSRLDELQAAILRVLLPHLDGWADGRRAAARALRGRRARRARDAAGRRRPGSAPAWHLYVVNHERADELAAGLARAGVESRAYYRTPVHRQPAMAAFADGVALPATDELARTHLALPMSPVLSAEQAAEVVAARALRRCTPAG